MERLTVVAEERSSQESPNFLRQKGYIPAVVYSKDFNLLIKITKDKLNFLLSHAFSENKIIDLDIKDKETFPVLLKELQRHPLTEEVIHCDFLRVSMDKKIKVNIPLSIQGEAKGVKEGGVLEVFLHEIEVECLPQDIPSQIEVDISKLEIGKSVHIRDINLPPKVKSLAAAEEVVLSIVSPQKEEETETETEEAAPEPEVIKEKPKTEEEKQG
ncbi:MAG: 50S ribosomal protein L25 [Candidatus Omnitrophica bacterium]|nr:50S ribosomal protein L25 [Candidatus Omnitrophota bacterium]